MDDDKRVLPLSIDSPAKRALIIQLLQEYPVKNIAAAKAGVHPATLHRWMNEDQDFLELVEKAVEIGKSKQFDNILKASKDPRNWQAAAWLLERIDPVTFGRIDRAQVQVSGPGGGPVPVATASVDLRDTALASKMRDVVRVLHEAGRLPEGVTPTMLEVGDEHTGAAASAKSVGGSKAQEPEAGSQGAETDSPGQEGQPE